MVASKTNGGRGKGQPRPTDELQQTIEVVSKNMESAAV